MAVNLRTGYSCLFDRRAGTLVGSAQIIRLHVDPPGVGAGQCRAHAIAVHWAGEEGLGKAFDVTSRRHAKADSKPDRERG